MNITFSRIARRAVLLTAASLFLVQTASAQVQRNWTHLAGGTPGAWTNGSNWSPTGPPTRWAGNLPGVFTNNGATTDLAFFGNPSVAGTTVGIDMFGTGTLTLGGISFNSTTTAYVIGNSTGVAEVMVLNAASISTVTGALTGTTNFIVVSDASTQNATIQNVSGAGTSTLGIRLGATSGGMYVTGSRTLTLDTIMSQTLAGSGFTKTGAGTLVLGQNNTFSGTVSITGGTLQVGNGAATGDRGIGAGAISNTGTLAFNKTGTYIFANAVSGAAGNVTQMNASATATFSGNMTNTGTFTNTAGTSILTGSNSYVGTTITAGTVQVGSGGATGTLGSGAVTNGGSLVFDRTGTFTVSNSVSGGGSVTQQNASATTTFSGNLTHLGLFTNTIGTSILTGANSYSATTITAGTVQVGNAGTTGSLGIGAVANGGSLVFDRTDSTTVANVINGAGSVTKNGAGTLQLTGASGNTGTILVNAGTLSLGNGGASGSVGAGASISLVNAGSNLTVDRSDAVAQSVFMGGRTISGLGSFTKEGAGTLTFDVANTYSGVTNVNNGILLVNAALTSGQVTVASGATLGGNSSITADVVVNNGGNLTAGTSPGTLSVTGNFTLNSTSNSFFELANADQTPGGANNDLVDIRGNLILDGILNVIGTPGVFTVSNGDMWRLFNYTGTLTDNGLTFGSMPGFVGGYSWVLSTSTPGQVNLVAIPEPSTFVLLGAIGMIGIVAVRRRKAKLAA